MEILTQKYGPLPGWAWLGIIGVGGFLLLKGKGIGSSSSSDQPSSFDGQDVQIQPPSSVTTSVTAKGRPFFDFLNESQAKKLRKYARSHGIVGKNYHPNA